MFLDGTCVIAEVRLAFEKGYKILKFQEIYEYRVTQYDPTTGQGGLFVAYINRFLKFKLRPADTRAGYEPQTMKTDTLHRSGRVRESFRKKAAIEYNAAKRGLAKLC
jgi:hypothetical protein